jgi:hypothetical protein
MAKQAEIGEVEAHGAPSSLAKGDYAFSPLHASFLALIFVLYEAAGCVDPESAKAVAGRSALDRGGCPRFVRIAARLDFG